MLRPTGCESSIQQEIGTVLGISIHAASPRLAIIAAQSAGTAPREGISMVRAEPRCVRVAGRRER
jgi:hypothetical protein